MRRNSIYYSMDVDEAKLLHSCNEYHMAEEPFFCKLEMTDKIVSALNYHSKIPAHKIYFKYDSKKKVSGIEIDTTPILQWIDSFSVFYDFPYVFKNKIYKLFPNKVFGNTHNHTQTLLPESDE